MLAPRSARHVTTLLSLLSLPLLAAARPLPEPKPHVIDKAHSEINFVADSRLLSAHGFFGKWDADVKLDAASINTRVERRDGHLKSADFFDVAKHPTITFKSVSVASAGANKLEITGDLTVRGTTRRITVPATMMFYEQGTGRFRGTFTINRMDYGVSYDSKLNPIQPEVQVQWDIALSEPKPPAK